VVLDPVVPALVVLGLAGGCSSKQPHCQAVKQPRPRRLRYLDGGAFPGPGATFAVRRARLPSVARPRARRTICERRDGLMDGSRSALILRRACATHPRSATGGQVRGRGVLFDRAPPTSFDRSTLPARFNRARLPGTRRARGATLSQRGGGDAAQAAAGTLTFRGTKAGRIQKAGRWSEPKHRRSCDAAGDAVRQGGGDTGDAMCCAPRLAPRSERGSFAGRRGHEGAGIGVDGRVTTCSSCMHRSSAPAVDFGRRSAWRDLRRSGERQVARAISEGHDTRVERPGPVRVRAPRRRTSRRSVSSARSARAGLFAETDSYTTEVGSDPDLDSRAPQRVAST